MSSWEETTDWLRAKTRKNRHALIAAILIAIVRKYIYLSLSWSLIVYWDHQGTDSRGPLPFHEFFCPSKMIFQMLPPLSSWQEIPIRFSSRRESTPPCDARISRVLCATQRRHPTMDKKVSNFSDSFCRMVFVCLINLMSGGLLVISFNSIKICLSVVYGLVISLWDVRLWFKFWKR